MYIFFKPMDNKLWPLEKYPEVIDMYEQGSQSIIRVIHGTKSTVDIVENKSIWH